jgi:hypothetical protein
MIKAMAARGDRQIDIAYWFGVSPSTVNRIKQGIMFGGVGVYEGPALPPPGPYVVVPKKQNEQATEDQQAYHTMLRELRELVRTYELKLNHKAAGQHDDAGRRAQA